MPSFHSRLTIFDTSSDDTLCTFLHALQFYIYRRDSEGTKTDSIPGLPRFLQNGGRSALVILTL